MLSTYTYGLAPANIYYQNQHNYSSLHIFLIIAGFVFIFIVFLSIRGRGERIKFIIKRLLLVELIYIISVISLLMYTKGNVKSFFGLFIVLLVFIAIFSKLLPKQKRTRHISTATKKMLIENFEQRTGKTYDPRKYEIHHIIPYSKGGNSTTENLKIIPKHKNRAISNKSPWWDVFGLFGK